MIANAMSFTFNEHCELRIQNSSTNIPVYDTFEIYDPEFCCSVVIVRIIEFDNENNLKIVTKSNIRQLCATIICDKNSSVLSVVKSILNTMIEYLYSDYFKEIGIERPIREMDMIKMFISSNVSILK